MMFGEQGGPKSKSQAIYIYNVITLHLENTGVLTWNSFNSFFELHLFSFLRFSIKILSFTLHARFDGTHYVMHQIFN